MSFKDISTWSSGGPFIQRSGNLCVILVDGIMRNNSVNIFRIWASDSGDIVSKISYLELWAALLFS